MLNQNLDRTIKFNSKINPITTIIYICVAIFVSLLFLAALYKPIVTTFFEQDLWWEIPTLHHIMKNNSFFKTLNVYLFNPYPTFYGEPSLNSFLSVVLLSFGPQPKYFIFTTLILHFSCAILLLLVCRKMGLNFRISFFSSLLYLVLFVHFQSYMWPMAAQHLMVMFISLLVILLYLETNRQIDRGSSYRLYFDLTLFVNFIASFFQISILILPAIILSHILFCSRDSKERVKKYDTWLPLFITYLGYILLRIVYFSQPNFNKYLAIAKLSRYINPEISGGVWNSWMAYPIFFIIGLTCLFLFRFILKAYQKFNKPLMFFLIIIIMLGIILPTGLYNKLCLLLNPYKLIRPFSSMLATLIHPIKYTLLTNSTKPYHFIPIKTNFFDILLGLFFMIVFIKLFLMRNKGLIIFFILYIFSLRQTFKSIGMPSRYFIYTSPILCIIFCSVLIYFYNYLMGRIRLKAVTKELILAFIIIGIVIPNIFAIRLEISRGKLANTFLIYDYIRTANIMKKDINNIKDIDGENIYVNNVVGMPFEYWEFSPVDPLRQDNFRYVLAQVLNNPLMLDINVNRSPPKKEGKIIYTINGKKVLNIQGKNLDDFYQSFEEAMREMSLGHQEEAIYFFKKAIETRPFLLNYLLSDCKLENLKWITNGLSLREWINDMANVYKRWGKPAKKLIYIAAYINDEVTDYAKCLFYISYLKYISEDLVESRYWLSQMRFIDTDYYNSLSLPLDKHSFVQPNRDFLSFLQKLGNNQFSKEKKYINFYELFKFIMI